MQASVLMNVAVPGSGRVSFLPRAGFVNPSYTNIDVRLSKQFRIIERFNVELRGEAFNLFNSTLVLAVDAGAYNYASPNASSTTCPSATHVNTCMVPLKTFQRPTTTTANLLGARQLQAGVRFNF